MRTLRQRVGECVAGEGGGAVGGCLVVHALDTLRRLSAQPGTKAVARVLETPHPYHNKMVRGSFDDFFSPSFLPWQVVAANSRVLQCWVSCLFAATDGQGFFSSPCGVGAVFGNGKSEAVSARAPKVTIPVTVLVVPTTSFLRNVAAVRLVPTEIKKNV